MDSFSYNILLQFYTQNEPEDLPEVSLWKALILRAWIDLLVLKGKYQEHTYWETARAFLGSNNRKWRDLRQFAEETIGRDIGTTKRTYDKFISDGKFRKTFIDGLLEADAKRVFVDEFQGVDLNKVVDDF